jgi:PAS domain-containing protein
LAFATILFSLVIIFAIPLFGVAHKIYSYIYCALGFLIFLSSSIIFWYLKSLGGEIIDLDNLKKNLLSINQLNSEFKTILDNIDIAVCLRDEDLNITYFNSYYAHITLADDKPIDCNAIEIDKYTKELAKLTLLNKNKRTSERFIVVRGKRCLYQFIDSYIPHSNQVCTTAYDITDKDLVAKEL